MKTEIDWRAVSAAMYRSKYGRPQEGDMKLCEKAWKADEKRYSEEHKKVQEKVFNEMTLRGDA